MVNDREQLQEYERKGYTSSITDISILLDVKETKARELLKGVSRIDISERLYNELKKERLKAYRSYYNPTNVLLYLFRHEDERYKITVFYGDMRKVISKENVSGDEIKINEDYLIEHLPTFFFVLQVSKSINDIVIEDLGYQFLMYGKDNEVIYSNDKDDLKTYKELTEKSTLIKYTRMIKRDFYIRFQIGKRKNLYFQSIRRHKIGDWKERIIKLIEDYESQYR